VDINVATEEAALSEVEKSTSFPLALARPTGWTGVGTAARESFCTGRKIANLEQEFWAQILALDPFVTDPLDGWGGSVPGQPTGLLRSPTFTNYGFNPSVAATFTLPTLLLQGFEDNVVTRANSINIFNSLTSVTDKVLVEVECSSHQFIAEGCSAPGCADTDPTTPCRCDDGDPNTTPYGQDSQMWEGPYRTVAAAIEEWVKYGTFDGTECGYFNVNPGGIATELQTPNCPVEP
jgi:hypothetical protein